MRTWLKLVALSVVALPSVVVAADPPPLSLGDVLAAARSENPDIRAARQAWKVRRDEIAPAAAWPNPMLTYEDERFPSSGDAPAEVIRHYRVDQTVPFPGKLSLDARMKHHEALIAEANYRDKEIEVIGNVRVRYYQLYLIDRRIQLAQDSVSTLGTILKTAQSRLAAGQSSTSDVFMAQLELRKAENALFEARQARTLDEIELNTLLNRRTDSPLGAAAAPEVIDLPAGLDAFEDAARRTAPLYWEAAHEQNHARTMQRRDRLDFAPDFAFSYEREVPENGASGQKVGVGLSVPLWLTRPIADVRRSKEHLLEVEASGDAMRNLVLKMVHTEFTETTTRLGLARSYEHDILPTARSNFRVVQEQYGSGRGDFLRVLEAYRTWIDANDAYQEQLFRYAEHWSLLERWVGADLLSLKETSHAP